MTNCKKRARIAFIESPEFYASDADQILDATIPERTADNPFFTDTEIRLLLRQMHYLQFTARSASDPATAASLRREAIAIRNRIVVTHLSLIHMIVQRFRRDSLQDERFSAGCLALIRAVEIFDFSRHDASFLTYAHKAIRSRIALSRQRERARREWQTTDNDDEFDPIAHVAAPDNAIDRIDNLDLLDNLMERLPPRDTSVLVELFGLDGHTAAPSQSALAAHLRISIQRVRQLQSRAIGRLREYAAQ